jgi:hypothetical protein
MADDIGGHGAAEGAPLSICLRIPGVERRLGLLEQSDFAAAGGFRCFGGQISRNRIEGCGNRQNGIVNLADPGHLFAAPLG